MKSLPTTINNISIEKMKNISKEMIIGKTNLLEGCRDIYSLRMNTPLPDDEIFSPFIAIVSDMDYVPADKARENFGKEYLKRVDNESKDYLDALNESILLACNQLIEELRNNSKWQLQENNT